MGLSSSFLILCVHSSKFLPSSAIHFCPSLLLSRSFSSSAPVLSSPASFNKSFSHWLHLKFSSVSLAVMFMLFILSFSMINLLYALICFASFRHSSLLSPCPLMCDMMACGLHAVATLPQYPHFHLLVAASYFTCPLAYSRSSPGVPKHTLDLLSILPVSTSPLTSFPLSLQWYFSCFFLVSSFMNLVPHLVLHPSSSLFVRISHSIFSSQCFLSSFSSLKCFVHASHFAIFSSFVSSPRYSFLNPH